MRTMGVFDEVRALRPYAIWEGAVARALHGEELTVAVIDLAPNVAVPEHRHVNEQLGFVAEGSVTMTVGGESRELRPGGAWVIPAHVPHSVPRRVARR